MSLQLLSLSFLACLLLLAVVSDVRSRRIPNALVLYGTLLGLAVQSLAPLGAGLLQGGGLGFQGAVLGGLTGLALFLPLYLLRMMGAGDVKLLAMVGVWLGVDAVVQAAMWTLLAGGVLSLVAIVVRGSAHQVALNLMALCGNTARRILGGGAQRAVAVTGRLPYGLAIAAGTAVEMAQRLNAL